MIRRITVRDIPLSLTTTRWQFLVFGWHFLTCYTMRFNHIPVQPGLEMVNYWIYFGPKNLGIGFSFPRFTRIK